MVQGFGECRVVVGSESDDDAVALVGVGVLAPVVGEPLDDDSALAAALEDVCFGSGAGEYSVEAADDGGECGAGDGSEGGDDGVAAATVDAPEVLGAAA